MDLGLKGKVAIVTGGGRGIGRGCSTALAEEGWNLVIADLSYDDESRTALARLREIYGVDILDLTADACS